MKSHRFYFTVWFLAIVALLVPWPANIVRVNAAQGPALVDMPRPVVITFLASYDATGALTGLSATTTVSILESVPSGKLERRSRAVTIDLFEMAEQEVGFGKERTTYRDIGKEVMAMVTQEIKRQGYSGPLPVEATVQSGRAAVRATP